ncbi:TonB-dependent receptor [Pleomorphovibrio marinus]|uniref:TonB-dependent receptor n=1 Tax=Pleomorphovibrio marinus TaxID=2164132 RepID=UPI0018E52548|nr:TonB-dependent receptor [Pleomorphovibrio marinus]
MLIRINLIKSRFLLLLLLSSAFTSMMAKPGDEVVIKDGRGMPIPHAIVKWGSEGFSTVDENGVFRITQALAGVEEIEIMALGFATKKVRVANLSQGQDILLKEHLGQLNEVVVAATRTNRSVADLPMPVQVINQEKIQETGGMRLSEVLREQTGLQVVSNHGAGLQMQGLSSDYILILLDGEPLIGRTAGTFDLDRISVSNIERIEVLRGPSSAIYGSEAMAGVINIITKESSEAVQGTVQGRYRSFNTQDLTTEGGIHQNGWNIYGFYNRFSTDGFDLTPQVLGNTQSPYHAHTGQIKLGKKIGDRWEAKTFVRGYSEVSHDLMGVNSNGETQAANMTGTRRELNVNPTLSYRPGEDWLFTLRGMTSLFSTRSETWFEESGNRLDFQEFDQLYHRTELQVDHQLTKDQLLTVGVGHLLETVDATRYDDLNRFDAAYLFLQHQWEPAEKWNLVSGMRADLHSQYGGQVSPKVSAMYQVRENFSWQVSIGAGFKAPDFRQLLLNFNNASSGYYVFGANLVQEGIANLRAQGLVQQILIDPSQFGKLDAESSWALNTGGKWQPHEDFWLQVNLFRNHIENLIETAPVARLTSGQNAFSYFNISSVITQGTEMDIIYRLSEQLQLSLGYMYLDSRDREVLAAIDAGEMYHRDRQNRTRLVTRSDYGGLFNRSRHSGNIKLNYYEALTGLCVALRGIYRGPFGFGDVNGNLILDDPREYAPGIFHTNITLSKTFERGLMIEAGGFNVLNQLTIHDPTNPGRTYFMGVKLPLHQYLKN